MAEIDTGLADSDKERIAKRLRDAREARELSQTALAKQAGLSRSSIVHYENAKAVPGGLELIKLSKALRKSPNYILSGSENFEESGAEEHVLAGDYDQIQTLRFTILMQSLDRSTREHLSALVVDMVRQRKTDSEFAALMKVIDALDEQFRGGLGEGLNQLLEAEDWSPLTDKLSAIAENVDSD